MCNIYVKYLLTRYIIMWRAVISGPDWSTSFFDTSNSVIWHVKWCDLTCIFFEMQSRKRCSIEILVENETTEQINNETAQQVREKNRFWLCFTGNGDT